MNRLQKAVTALIVLFTVSFADGAFGLGFSDNFYVFIGVADATALYFIWREVFPRKDK